ncbi:MAG: hypothetical protein NC184_05335 [Roseburia sp.]|nr:hypothetical protein [Roseburia sp.]
MANDKTIFVEREAYTKDDKTYFSYFVKGTVRGKDIRIGIIPPDNGGYTVLDIVFDGAMKAELVLKPYEIRDEKTKKVTKGNSYAVVSKDEATGMTYECQIKPSRKSDKDLLDMLLKQSGN